MELIKCRTCLRLSDKNDCVDIESRCYLEQSIKQAILRLVPEMVLTIDDDDVVCRKCLRTLKICVKFIKTCLTVEMILAHNKKPFDIPPEGLDMEEVKIEIEEIEDMLEQIDSDHNYYMKQEIADSVDDDDDENEKDINNENESSNSIASSLQVLFGQPSLLLKSNSVENIILEISGSPEASETDAVKVEINDSRKEANFECCICPLKFNSDEEYELHLKTHILPCPFCAQTFSTETEYHNHIPQHKESMIKICELCGKTLKGARSLKTHMITMHGLPSLQICDRSISVNHHGSEIENNSNLDLLISRQEMYETSNIFSMSLQEHSLLQDNSTEDIILEISDSPEASGAVNTEIDDTPGDKCVFVCSICCLKFRDGEKYELHMETHTLACPFCGKTFRTKAEYNDHTSEHEESLMKICEFCGKALKGARSLKMHITALHELPSRHICDKCPKSFKHKYKVNLHVKEVHEKARQQQCSACGKLFVNSERCKSHYKLVHLKLKPYVCSICGNKYGRKDYLDKHKADHCGLKKNGQPKSTKLPKHGIRLKNPGKPVICRVCNREIGSVHLLKAHLESHVKIKRYKCKYCDLTFSVPNNKKRHEKLHESDSENKFRCNICWKRMKTGEELEQHINGHDRPPQYSCDECGEKFHRRYLLKNHISEKHTSTEDIEKAIEEIVVKNLLEYADPKSK